MAKRLSYSVMMLAWSTFPAFAGDGGTSDGVGAFVIQAAAHVLRSVIGWF